MPSKVELTQQAIEKLGAQCEWTQEQALKSWWRNIHGQGLQLSVTGYHIFIRAGFEPFEFELKDSWVPAKSIIVLDRRITYPWAWVRNKSGKPSLILFNSADAVMLTLYGDFAAWITGLDHK